MTWDTNTSKSGQPRNISAPAEKALYSNTWPGNSLLAGVYVFPHFRGRFPIAYFSFSYVLVKPFLELLTVNVPFRCAETLIQ